MPKKLKYYNGCACFRLPGSDRTQQHLTIAAYSWKQALEILSPFSSGHTLHSMREYWTMVNSPPSHLDAQTEPSMFVYEGHCWSEPRRLV